MVCVHVLKISLPATLRSNESFLVPVHLVPQLPHSVLEAFPIRSSHASRSPVKFTRTSGFVIVSIQISEDGLSVILPKKLITLNGFTLINLDAFAWSIKTTLAALDVTKGPLCKKLVELAASKVKA